VKRIPEIFLDVDGIFADFANTVLRLFGLEQPERLQWDLMDDDLVGSLCNHEDRMWDHINAQGHDFWATLPQLPWARELYELFKESGEYVGFCTSPAKSPWSCSGKYAWLERFAGPQDVRNIHITPHKHYVAKPTALLVDDHHVKVSLFRDHGGHVLPFPAPWHIRPDLVLDPQKLVEHVREELELVLRKFNGGG